MARFRISQKEIEAFLKEILFPEHHRLIPSWIKKVSLQEISGMKLLRSIHRTQGRKWLRPVSRSSKDFYLTQSVRSSAKPLDSSRSAVLKLIKSPKIQERFMPMVFAYIRNWASIPENLAHEKALVSFFNSFKPWQRSMSAIKASEVKDIKVAFELGTPSERKRLLLRGNLNVNDFWPVALRTSSYQDAFVGHCGDPKATKIFDFTTSVVGKIMPDHRLNYTKIR